jgi:hypothetical protein
MAKEPLPACQFQENSIERKKIMGGENGVRSIWRINSIFIDIKKNNPRGLALYESSFRFISSSGISDISFTSPLRSQLHRGHILLYSTIWLPVQTMRINPGLLRACRLLTFLLNRSRLALIQASDKINVIGQNATGKE